MSPAGRIARYWIPVFCYAAFILFLSSRPNLPSPAGVPDKPIHVVEYGILAALVSRAVLQTRRPTLGTMVVVFLICALFAAFDEKFQSYIPGRESSPLDWLADLAGIGIVIPLILLRSTKQASG